LDTDQKNNFVELSKLCRTLN